MSDLLEERLNLTTEQLRAIFARPVAYHKLLAIAGGSVGAGVFLSQLIYWTDKSKDPDGWIYKTLDDWWCETALGRYELKTIRNALIVRELIEEKLCGVPAKLHYKIQWPELQTALAKAVITHREGMSKRGAPTNKYVAMPQTGDATDKNGASPQATCRSESTTESTKTKSVVITSLACAEDSTRDISDKLTMEFGLSPTQGRSLDAYPVEYLLEKAEIIRSVPRVNAGRDFMAALRDNWQPAKRTVKTKPSRQSSFWTEETVEGLCAEEKAKKELAALRSAITSSPSSAS